MIYIFGTQRGDYDYHHSDIRTAWHLADGLAAAGMDTCVLWGGGECAEDSVRHAPYDTADLGAGDILFCVTPQMGRLALTMPNLATAGRRWLWPYACMDDEFNGAYDLIFVENDEIVEFARDQNPDSRVEWCMFGAPEKVDADIGADRTDVVAYAGRLMSLPTDAPCVHRVSQLGLIANQLPGNFTMWVASASVTLPPVPCNGFRGDVPDEYHGKTLHAPLDFDGDPEQRGGDVYMRPADLVDVVTAGINNRRIEFVGPQKYGSFWNRLAAAACFIDFGFEGKSPGPNCKIIDPLRVGCPVVADGESFSHYLLSKHDMGEVVTYRHPYAMARAIERQSAKPRDRAKCAADFVAVEGWRVRCRNLARYAR
jgi:hypothetical protein